MDEFWTDKKVFQIILYCFAIAGAVLGAVVGLGSEPPSVLDRVLGALLVALIFTGFIMIIGLAITFLEALIKTVKQWIKVKRAKGDAYFMIERGSIDILSWRFEEVVSELRAQGDDREARHLLSHLYELKENENEIKKAS